MLTRSLYTLKHAWQHRQSLREYLRPDSVWQTACLTDLKPKQLRARGVTVLALDFDGVMANHGAPEPLPAVQTWLKDAVQVFPKGHLFILSNKPSSERAHYFQQHFPSIAFVKASRKKPYPEGVQAIMAQTHAAPNAIVLVDDRLLTGVLATQIAGTRALYITRPYRDLRHHWVVEGFFALLRTMERVMVQWIKS